LAYKDYLEDLWGFVASPENLKNTLLNRPVLNILTIGNGSGRGMGEPFKPLGDSGG